MSHYNSKDKIEVLCNMYYGPTVSGSGLEGVHCTGQAYMYI